MNSIVDRLHRSEYTGDDRCWPCTAVNLLALAAIAGVLAVRDRRPLAAAVAVGGVVAIGLRGYLIPYTPRFAPRLVASLPIDPFHREDAAGSLAEPGAETAPGGDELVAALAEAGVLVLDGEDLFLASSFRDRWREEMAALREREIDDLAAIASSVTPPSVSVRTGRNFGSSYLVLDPAEGSLSTLQRPIAIVELAAARALADRIDDDRLRLAAGRPLRTFLEECPLCGDELVVTDASCCGEVTAVGQEPPEKLICTDCNVRYFTYE